jgi:chorismate dehydratase
MPVRLGSVPYLNARPLVWALESGLVPGYAVEYAVPSRLPAMLDGGGFAAVLVSSVEAFRRPAAWCAPGAGVATHGAVGSVRLFSKVPFDEVETLGLDESSMTSNLLARLVLDQVYGARPATSLGPPDLHAQLASADACVLIGDPCLAADGAGLHVLDLGLAWHGLTGLPFVWAMWVGDEALPGVAADLARSADAGQASLAEIAPPGRLAYLQGFDYTLSAGCMKGLEEFRRRLVGSGLLESAAPARWVEARLGAR